ncbi:hypothetical protein ACLQ18_13320 [Streptomyces sp. DT193]|uniref:hypothetical protein n=1 Tax=Streptomyces sp. DT193 TaxID=3393418 RepID=UPI003CE85DC0
MTMQNNLTGDDLFSYIILLRSGPTAKKYLLCEGDSDCAVLDPHINEDVCETIPGYGKNSVLDAINIVSQQNVHGVAALLDRDWQKGNSALPSSAVSTDHYDIDATVFYTGDACKRVVAAFCDRNIVRTFLGEGGWSSPAEVATALAFPVGVLRKLNHEAGWGLRFADTPFSEVALPSSRGVDLTKTVASALSRSKQPRAAKQDIPRIAHSAQRAMENIQDPRFFCTGHDLNSALAYLMFSKWSARINRKTLERAMRAAFSCSEISSTAIFANIPPVLKCSSTQLFTCA